MVTLACLAAAGFALGMFFNVYALAASMGLVAIVVCAFAVTIGFGQATTSLAVGLVLVQIGYLVGLSTASRVDA
ncbi:MAG: hypothetical protein ABR970_06440 [Roseiarcus sp.]|jgi:hypothetical protein